MICDELNTAAASYQLAACPEASGSSKETKNLWGTHLDEQHVVQVDRFRGQSFFLVKKSPMDVVFLFLNYVL